MLDGDADQVAAEIIAILTERAGAMQGDGR